LREQTVLCALVQRSETIMTSLFMANTSAPASLSKNSHGNEIAIVKAAQLFLNLLKVHSFDVHTWMITFGLQCWLLRWWMEWITITTLMARQWVVW